VGQGSNVQERGSVFEVTDGGVGVFRKGGKQPNYGKGEDIEGGKRGGVSKLSLTL